MIILLFLFGLDKIDNSVGRLFLFHELLIDQMNYISWYIKLYIYAYHLVKVNTDFFLNKLYKTKNFSKARSRWIIGRTLLQKNLLISIDSISSIVALKHSPSLSPKFATLPGISLAFPVFWICLLRYFASS